MQDFLFVILNVLMGGLGALITSISKTDDKAFILPKKESNKILLGTLWDILIGMIITFVFCYIPIPEKIQVILGLFTTTAEDKLFYSCLTSFIIGLSSEYLLRTINKLKGQ